MTAILMFLTSPSILASTVAIFSLAMFRISAKKPWTFSNIERVSVLYMIWVFPSLPSLRTFCIALADS